MATTSRESCINKLLLVCFCLDLPVREVFAPVAVLMGKRILADNIIEIAKLVNSRLTDYCHQYNRRLKRSFESGEEENIVGATNAKRKAGRQLRYPTTMPQLERKLDAVLVCLGAKKSLSGRRLNAAGLIKTTPRRSKRDRCYHRGLGTILRSVDGARTKLQTAFSI
jgi:hypothetical protein